MKNIKLIIDMPEDLYKEKIRGTTSNRQDRKILECVKNGTPLSAELEEIKTEIEDMGWDIYKTERKVPHKYVEKERIYELLDNRIKELKGENNENQI